MEETRRNHGGKMKEKWRSHDDEHVGNMVPRNGEMKDLLKFRSFFFN